MTNIDWILSPNNNQGVLKHQHNGNYRKVPEKPWLYWTFTVRGTRGELTWYETKDFASFLGGRGGLSLVSWG